MSINQFTVVQCLYRFVKLYLFCGFKENLILLRNDKSDWVDFSIEGKNIFLWVPDTKLESRTKLIQLRIKNLKDKKK